ncbi:type IV pilus biogenesis protein PilP [Salmonella enterica subsp. enterica serovar Newport]|nr:type IV pilus biogenesis protein PilP [Salmonella enterica subsp. enterica serovar Newport]
MLRNSLFAVLMLLPVLVRAAGTTPAPVTTLPPPAPASVPVPATAPPDVKTVVPPSTGGTVAHMEDIQAQTLLYKAQLMRDKALAELQKISSNSDSLPVSVGPLSYDTSASAPVSSARDDASPQVIQITGDGKTFSALIRTNRGSQLIVHAGNTIPGTNLKVDKITFDAVTVSTAGKPPRILAFVED